MRGERRRAFDGCNMYRRRSELTHRSFSLLTLIPGCSCCPAYASASAPTPVIRYTLSDGCGFLVYAENTGRMLSFTVRRGVAHIP